MAVRRSNWNQLEQPLVTIADSDAAVDTTNNTGGTSISSE
jgi:hypothetical protein